MRFRYHLIPKPQKPGASGQRLLKTTRRKPAAIETIGQTVALIICRRTTDKGMRIDWGAISGPALTAPTAPTPFVVDRHFVAVPNPAPLFVCIVALAASISGITSGLISAAIAVASSALFFVNHRATPGYDVSDLVRLVMLAMTAAGTAAITGLLRKKMMDAFAWERRH